MHRGGKEEMVPNVASTQTDHVATKTEGRTVDKDLQEIKNKEGIDRKVLRWSGISTVTFSTWLDLPGVITPADIAHSLIETHKPPHRRAVMEIRKYQKSTNLLIQKLPFSKVVSWSPTYIRTLVSQPARYTDFISYVQSLISLYPTSVRGSH
jgi:hypothetical protein